jgi:hypothetical protein
MQNAASKSVSKIKRKATKAEIVDTASTSSSSKSKSKPEAKRTKNATEGVSRPRKKQTTKREEPLEKKSFITDKAMKWKPRGKKINKANFKKEGPKKSPRWIPAAGPEDYSKPRKMFPVGPLYPMRDI